MLDKTSEIVYDINRFQPRIAQPFGNDDFSRLVWEEASKAYRTFGFEHSARAQRSVVATSEIVSVRILLSIAEAYFYPEEEGCSSNKSALIWEQ